ncbi:hypothetical protein [Haematobacter massiliensis]|uniref:hypothetical protein n=1 Tax=Haematobacter massiliensis TaxID=195105 RepID=UPI0023F0C802|nr:hypothetical protein [Haematobacter massiliensis]
MLSYPLSLALLNDLLPVQSIEWHVQRSDEFSGSGDGRVWSAELAPPLWRAVVTLSDMSEARGREVAARFRALHGSRRAFFLLDPGGRYPATDPGGGKLGAPAVTLTAIETGREGVTFAGLPAGYRLSAGDKFAATYGSGSRHYFGEVSEGVTAGAGGVAAGVSVFPRLPAGVLQGSGVTFARPAAKMIIDPQAGVTPGTTIGAVGVRRITGAGFTAIQKK